MSLYTRARKHIDMKRVKEMREEKIKREKIAEILRQQEEIRAELAEIEAEESKHVDWRQELDEAMTTASLGMINLPAEGNVDIIDTDTTMDNINSSLSQNDSRSGNTITLQGTENQIVDGEHTYFNTARFTVDATRVSHVKITISKGGGTSSWTDRGGESFDDDVTLNISDADDFFAPIFNNTNLTSGTHLISLPGNYKNLRISFEQFGKVGETGALTISNVSLQRRTPLGILVSLDDPDASSFIRDGMVDTLSPSQKKKKLEKQLKASNEYLYKMFGEGMPSGATEIADYDPQQSFEDLASETEKNFSDFATDARNPMGTGDQALDREMTALLASPLVQAAASQGLAALAALIGSIGTAAQIMRAIGGTDYGAAPGRETIAPLPGRGGIAGGRELTPQQQAEVEAAADELRDARRALNDLPADATDAQKDMAQERLDRATKNRQRVRNKHKQENQQRPRTESYKPNGSYISEKKKLKSPKDLADKIPGYYDGKPAPLGFPIVEPPKMKDGMHPDLVDGKKTAKRFNRLDPVSARAMPKTGNPHIDKKVRAAAKKPK